MVKEGYKETEIGVIPEDWRFSHAKELMNIKTGSKNTEHKSNDGRYPLFVRSQQVEHIDNYSYDCEAVLTAGDGVGTGKVFHYINGKFDAHQRVYVMSQFKGIYGKFFYYYFKENFGYEVLKYTAKSSVDSVRKDMIAEMLIPIPLMGEQQKIVEALSDMDNLISSLEKLIEKKEAIKQACLQKMFPKEGESVPEMRLPGFTDAWEQRKLNEVVNVYDGVHQTPDYKDSGVMFLSVENISTLKSEKYISEEAFQRDYKVYPQKGDILMTRIGDVGTPNVVEITEKVAFYVSLALLKPTKINSYFLCNSIQSPLFQKGLKDRTLVTAIPQKINKDEIGKVNIILPTSSQEQGLIGEYFRKLDHLITLHQHKLEKCKKIKEGMMQQLLTGKIRLI